MQNACISKEWTCKTASKERTQVSTYSKAIEDELDFPNNKYTIRDQMSKWN